MRGLCLIIAFIIYSTTFISGSLVLIHGYTTPHNIPTRSSELVDGLCKDGTEPTIVPAWTYSSYNRLCTEYYYNNYYKTLMGGILMFYIHNVLGVALRFAQDTIEPIETRVKDIITEFFKRFYSDFESRSAQIRLTGVIFFLFIITFLRGSPF